MATKNALNEASGFVAQVLARLTAQLSGPPTIAGAQLMWLCGNLASSAGDELEVPSIESAPAQFWADFASCFEQARVAGVTYQGMDAIWQLVSSFIPETMLGVAVINFSLRMTLVEQAKILAATTFVSRDVIDVYLGLIDTNFSVAENVAADNKDNVAYVALVKMHAAVVNDLSTRAAPLPAVVIVTLPRRQPILSISQMFYQTAGEVDAILGMNDVVHPAFCPATLKMLSV